MSRHGFRHVPVTEQGRVVGIVSERDLFAMQRLSLEQVSAIRAAQDAPRSRRRRWTSAASPATCSRRASARASSRS